MRKEIIIAYQKLQASKKERDSFAEEYEKYHSRMKELNTQKQQDERDYVALMWKWNPETDEIAQDALDKI